MYKWPSIFSFPSLQRVPPCTDLVFPVTSVWLWAETEDLQLWETLCWNLISCNCSHSPVLSSEIKSLLLPFPYPISYPFGDPKPILTNHYIHKNIQQTRAKQHQRFSLAFFFFSHLIQIWYQRQKGILLSWSFSCSYLHFVLLLTANQFKQKQILLQPQIRTACVCFFYMKDSW